jgi:hypothetical protein
VIGGFVAEKKGFRWLEWVMLFFMIATYLYSLWLKETYKPIILKRRRRRLGIPEAHKSINEPSALRVFLTATLLRPLTMLITEPIVTCFSLYVAVDFGILFTFFASFPLVYSRVYDFNSGQIGLTFLPIMIGCLLATLTCVLCDRLLYQKELLRVSARTDSGTNLQDGEVASTHNSRELPRIKVYVEPEHRLYAAMIGGIGIPIGLFWFAWTARSDVHWASPVVSTIVFSWGNLSVFVSHSYYVRRCTVELTLRLKVSAMTYLIDSYGPQYGASAVSANSFSRYIFSAAFPLFAIQSMRPRPLFSRLPP